MVSDTYLEFKASLHELFPVIYDTKHIVRVESKRQNSEESKQKHQTVSM